MSYNRSDIDKKLDFIKRDYEIAKMSLVQIGKKYGCSTSTLSTRLKKIGVIIRGHKESGLLHAPKGTKNAFWKGGISHHVDGYVLAKAYDHPNKNRCSYVLEHRLVMEKHLGRYLEPWEYIHHKNGIKDDNRIENLEIVINQKHYGNIRCPHCLKNFLIR